MQVLLNFYLNATAWILIRVVIHRSDVLPGSMQNLNSRLFSGTWPTAINAELELM